MSGDPVRRGGPTWLLEEWRPYRGAACSWVVNRDDPDRPGHWTNAFVGDSDNETGAEERAKVTAAAPALVRALLAVEWGPESTRGCCPYCAAGLGNSLPGDQKHGYARCALDAALTAAGLPDQASRDAARAAIRSLDKK